MKKFIFMIAFAVMTMVNVNAQTLEPSSFIDNTYIGVRGGATALTHPNCINGYEDWGHSIESAISLEVGKWITPKFGIGIEGTTGVRNGSKFGAFQKDLQFNLTGKSNTFNYVTVAGLGKFNLMNIFGGFKNRPFEMVAAAGPMWVHGFYKDSPLYSDGRNDLGVKFQVEFNFNLNDKWQFNLIPDFNYNLTNTPSKDSRPNFDERCSWYGIQAGFTYKIGKQFTESPYTHTNEEFDAMNEEINRLRSQEPEVVYVDKIVEKVVYQKGNDNLVVYFAKGSDKLEGTVTKVLDLVQPGATVELVGKASPEGSEQFNQDLSERRAMAVADYLIKKGIKVASVKGIGASEGSLSPRVVVVTVK